MALGLGRVRVAMQVRCTTYLGIVNDRNVGPFSQKCVHSAARDGRTLFIDLVPSGAKLKTEHKPLFRCSWLSMADLPDRADMPSHE